MPKCRITPLYVFFWLLFSEDAWRILIGVTAAALIAPAIMPPQTDLPGQIVIWVMLAAVGWWLSAYPGGRIAGFWKRSIFDHSPPPAKRKSPPTKKRGRR